MELQHPYGWQSLDPESVTYEFGEAKIGKGPNEIEPNPTGDQGGEDDYHSRAVDPDSKFGAAKVTPGLGNYGNNDEYKPVSGKDPANTGSVNIPMGHMVVEDGIVQGRTYYLVKDIKTDKLYTVIPEFKPGETYKSPMKGDRTSALEDAYRVLCATLPDSALAQLRERFPETLAL